MYYYLYALHTIPYITTEGCNYEQSHPDITNQTNHIVPFTMVS